MVALLAVGEKQIPVWRAQGSQGALWTETVRETSELSSVLCPLQAQKASDSTKEYRSAHIAGET